MKRSQIFTSRGAQILSLVPKTGQDSDPEEDVDVLEALPQEIEKKVAILFEEYDINDNELTSLDIQPEMFDIDNMPILFEDLEMPGTTVGLVAEGTGGQDRTIAMEEGVSKSPSQFGVSKSTRSRSKNAKKKIGQVTKKKQKKIVFKWKKMPFTKAVDLPNVILNRGEPDKSVLHYFLQFFDDELLDLIVNQTNLYSIQTTGKSANISKRDFLDFLAVELRMGLVKMSSFRDYWSDALRFEKVADIMSRNKYQHIRRFLHFSDNTKPNDDKYFKIRPVMEHIRKKCNDIEEEKCFSVDEMMVKYKGNKGGSRKQYMPRKPIKWGFKLFVRAGVSGVIYDFIIYGGAETFRDITFPNSETDMPMSAKVVLALSQSIKNPILSTLYFDRFFCSPDLIHTLRYKYGILSLGTLLPNRSAGAIAQLQSDKDLAKGGRGSYDSVCDNKKSVSIVKWYDNKPVFVASSYVACEPVKTVRRWERTTKRKIEVTCPNSILEYNRFMGGVDLGDMLISLHKTPLRTLKWYMAIFGQLIDIAVVNSWLLYKRDNPTKKIGIKDFRAELATMLLYYEKKLPKPTSRRNSNSASPSPTPTTQKKEEVLIKGVQKDQVGHFPTYGDRGKCRFCRKKTTTVSCIKCSLRLCLVPERNCFLQFHN